MPPPGPREAESGILPAMISESLARVTLALLAFASLSAQVVFTRVFSFLFWHHYAWLVLSLALLGYGASGARLALERARSAGEGGDLPPEIARSIGNAARALPLALLFPILVPFHSEELLASPFEAIRFLATACLLVVPFYFVGRAAALLYGAPGGPAGHRYAADLAGAAAGCLALAALLGPLDPVAWTLVLSLLLFALARRHAPPAPRRDPSPLAALLLLSLLLSGRAVPMVPAETKDMFLPLLDEAGSPSRVPESTRWHVATRVDVLAAESHPGFGFGGESTVRARGPVLHKLGVFQDGAAPTFLYKIDRPLSEIPVLRDNNQALAYRLAPTPDTLVIGSGGGPDLMIALANGARTVTAVEINPLIAGLVTGPYRAWTGDLFFRPGVTLVNLDGRAYVRSSDRSFDIIQLSGVDTFAALASGANAASENHLYTTEALSDYLARLTPRGLITFSRWAFDPPRETLRLFHTALDALAARGDTDPAAHVVALRGRAWSTLLVKNAPFTTAEVALLAAATSGTQFRVMFEPFGAFDNAYGRSARLTGRARDAFFAAHPYNVRPATDDRPFFFDFYKWGSLLTRDHGSGGYSITRFPVGRAVLLAGLLFSLLAGFFLIVRPLSRLPAVPAARATLGAFFALGFAFLCVEVTLAQKLSLLLGLPGLSFATVLPALLVAAGLGALLPPPASPERACRAAALAALAFALLTPAVAALPASSLPARALLSLALILPLGLPLGRPFPSLLSRVAPSGPAAVAWACGANGYAAVLAAILAAILAMEAGLTAMFVLAALAYLAAARFSREL